ncbi:MAG: hypothetical protein Ct9H300mP12_13950 [Acidimicrobiales bacterium]|nr:MAG: hypothetical protein Ct9H300mP12_13950 [Acidimicrobiales bacterium]
MGRWVAGILACPSTHFAGRADCKRTPTNSAVYVCPTHVHWGLDNRTVLARCIVEDGSTANRVEFRSAGADANHTC